MNGRLLVLPRKVSGGLFLLPGCLEPAVVFAIEMEVEQQGVALDFVG